MIHESEKTFKRVMIKMGYEFQPNLFDEEKDCWTKPGMGTPLNHKENYRKYLETGLTPSPF